MSSDLMHKFTVNGREYVVEPHNVRDGLAVIDKILQAGAGGLVSAFFGAMSIDPETSSSTVDMGAVTSRVDPQAIGQALSAGLSSVGGLMELAPLILKNTHLSGVGRLSDQVIFDNAFRRRYADLGAVVAKVVEYNGFFDLLLGFLGEPSEPVAPPSAS